METLFVPLWIAADSLRHRTLVHYMWGCVAMHEVADIFNLQSRDN